MGKPVYHHHHRVLCSYVSQVSQLSQDLVDVTLFETLVTVVTLLQTGHILMIANIWVFQHPDYRLRRSNSGW